MDFEESHIGKSVIQKLTVNNSGNEELEIYGIELPKLKGFLENEEYQIFSSDYIESFKMSETNPYILMAGATMKFDIIFRPDSAKDYLDSITIRTNSIENLLNPDSVCIIKGKGIKPIGVEEDPYCKIEIYPNPANDLIQIDNIPLNCEEIILFDEEGKKVREIKIRYSATSLKISTKDLTQGLYTIRIYSNRNIIDKKIIIER